MSEVNKEPLELFIAKRFPTPENKVPKKVLEIGTWGDPVFRKFGVGSYVQNFFEHGTQYFGLNVEDKDAKKIKRLSEQPQNPLLKQIRIESILGNGMQIPFGDNSFDLVFLSDVLTYRVLPNPQRGNADSYANQVAPDIQLEQANQIKLLDECLRVLNIGGKLVITNAYMTQVSNYKCLHDISQISIQ